VFDDRTVKAMAYHTGTGEGEIRSLRLDQIDLKAGLIRLKSLDTKTSEPRLVPLNHTLTALLKSATRYVNYPLVCPNPEKLHRAVPRYQASSIGHAFTRASRKVGVKDVMFHDLRQTCVTNALRSGIDMITVMAIAGHKTKTMAVFRRNNTVDANDLREAMRRTETAPATGDLRRSKG
jgi:integrase